MTHLPISLFDNMYCSSQCSQNAPAYALQSPRAASWDCKKISQSHSKMAAGTVVMRVPNQRSSVKKEEPVPRIQAIKLNEVGELALLLECSYLVPGV